MSDEDVASDNAGGKAARQFRFMKHFRDLGDRLKKSAPTHYAYLKQTGSVT